MERFKLEPKEELAGCCPSCGTPMLCPCPSCRDRREGRKVDGLEYVRLDDDTIECQKCGAQYSDDELLEWEARCIKVI